MINIVDIYSTFVVGRFNIFIMYFVISTLVNTYSAIAIALYKWELEIEIDYGVLGIEERVWSVWMAILAYSSMIVGWIFFILGTMVGNHGLLIHVKQNLALCQIGVLMAFFINLSICCDISDKENIVVICPCLYSYHVPCSIAHVCKLAYGPV